jgi:hypothetical protein
MSGYITNETLGASEAITPTGQQARGQQYEITLLAMYQYRNGTQVYLPCNWSIQNTTRSWVTGYNNMQKVKMMITIGDEYSITAYHPKFGSLTYPLPPYKAALTFMFR